MIQSYLSKTRGSHSCDGISPETEWGGVGAKAHDEKHSSAVAETMCDEEASRHSYSDVLPETKL